jgi:hypothetical protein
LDHKKMFNVMKLSNLMKVKLFFSLVLVVTISTFGGKFSTERLH